MITMLPKAVEDYRHQITRGLYNNRRAASKARVILRKLLGPIDLRPGPDKSLWAKYDLCPAALLITAGTGTTGSGGPLWALLAQSAEAPVIRLAYFAMLLQSRSACA